MIQSTNERLAAHVLCAANFLTSLQPHLANEKVQDALIY